MAELQIFTGMTLDTSVERNRRAFVDISGVPVKPEDTETQLGRRPDILLHKTDNWKAGKNTGLLGVIRHEGEADEVIPSGQFRQLERS